MSYKRPEILAGILTVLPLFIVAIVSVFVELIALNGVLDGRAGIALIVLVVFEVIILVIAWVFAGRAFRFLVVKFNGNKISAVAVAVIAGIFLGTVFSFFSVILSILLAGIK